MRVLFSTIQLFLFCAAPLFAQGGYQIRAKLNGLNYDTAWFGRSFGKRAVAEFPAVRQPDGWYEFKNDSLKPEGLYAIVYKRAAKAKYQYVPCWLPAGNRQFSFETDINDPFAAPKIAGSPENELFYQYLREAERPIDRRDSLAFEWRDRWDAESMQFWVAAEDSVRAVQDRFIQKNPKSLTAAFLKMTRQPAVPLAGKTPSEQAANRWAWFRKNYFATADPAAPALFSSPLGIEFMDYFVFKLPPPEPDSMKSAIRQVLALLEKNPDHFKYYFNYVVNSYGSMSKYRGDEVFYWLIKDWIEAGKAPWTKPEDLAKMSDEAKRMERVFTGLPAPQVTLFDRQLQPVALYETQAKHTLLVFWNPDCSHCKKELPLLQKICADYYARGLKVIAVCGKTRDQAPMCWEFLDKTPFPDAWLALHDPQAKSRVGSLYNLRTFPRMFLLDADKKIVWKRAGEVPERELVRVFDRFVGGK